MQALQIISAILTCSVISFMAQTWMKEQLILRESRSKDVPAVEQIP